LSAQDRKPPLPADVVLHKVGHKDLQLKVLERGNLSDKTQTLVNTRVGERVVGHVKPGRTCEVRIDALPGKVLKATVKSVAKVPRVGEFSIPGVKVYDTVVEITDPVEGLNLKPGLTAVVTINTAAKAERVLAVPLPTILPPAALGKKPRCLVVKPGA